MSWAGDEVPKDAAGAAKADESRREALMRKDVSCIFAVDAM